MLPTFLTPGRPTVVTLSRQVAPQSSESAPAPPAQNDKEALYELEKGVRAHRLSWIHAGVALAAINARGLYRFIDASFEEYLQRRWGFSKRYGYDLITAAGVAENVRGVKHALSVRGAVVLSRLKDAQAQAECLSQAIAGSGTRSPTADYLAAAVAARLGSKVKSRKSKVKRPKPVRVRLLPSAFCRLPLSITILGKPADVELRVLLEQMLAQLATTTSPSASAAAQQSASRESAERQQP